MSKLMNWINNWIGGGDCFLLRDEFTTLEAAPVASPRDCEPGPGITTFDQTDGQFLIIADELVWPVQATPTWGDQDFYSTDDTPAVYARKTGRVYKTRLALTSGSDLWWGFDPNPNPLFAAAAEISFFITGPTVGFSCLTDNIGDPTLRDIWPAYNDYVQLAIILGGYNLSGVHYFPGVTTPTGYLFGSHCYWRDERGEDGWRLVWYRWDIQMASQNLYPAFSNYQSAGMMDYHRIPCDSNESDVWSTQWPTMLTPTVYDLFTDKDATSLVNHIPTSPVGQAWLLAVGGWQILTNQANPDGTANAVAYTITTKSDVWVEAYLNTSTAETINGLVVRKSIDTGGGANHWLCVIGMGLAPATDTWIIEVNNGVTTTRASAAVGYTAETAYHLRVRATGDDITFYVNYTERAHYGTAVFNQTAVWHGLYSGADANALFDDFLILPRGTGGEYDTAFESF